MAENEIMQWTESYGRMMTTLRGYVTRLQSLVALDSLGRPTTLVNSQAVLSTGFTVPIDDFVDKAPADTFMPISYLEGLPTIEGIPIWEKLEYEPLEAYNIFKRYRAMRESSQKQRAVYKLALETGMEVRNLEILRQVYHWNLRVNAYDLYMDQERATQLEMRRVEIEGKHAEAAKKLFGISTEYLIGHADLLTPKLALQMLDVATKLERISSGMAPDARVTASGVPITIQNNIGETTKIGVQQVTTLTGELDKDKDRVKQVLNIMNNIGILKSSEPEEVIGEDIIDME